MPDPGDATQYEYAVACEAARQLRLTATTVDQVVGRIEGRLPLVREDWRGGARRQFDATIAPRQRHGRALAAGLRALARHIEEHAEAERQQQADTARMAMNRTQKTRNLPR